MNHIHNRAIYDDPKVRSLFGRARSDARCLSCRVREWSMCAGMTQEQHDPLETIKQERRFDPGETLFIEGDPADRVFTVTDGIARLARMLPDGRRQIVGFLFPGDLLGLAPAARYGCSAEAVTALKVCSFPRAGLDPISRADPAFDHRLREIAEVELAEAREQMLVLGRKTAPEKLASFLMLMRGKQHRLGHEDPDTLDAPMTRADIGDFLGLTLETVSRTFSKFVKDGLIALPSAKTIEIKEPARLSMLAVGG